MISETFVLIAFAGLLKPPTRHEGWSAPIPLVRYRDLDTPTHHDFRVGVLELLPSMGHGYFATDRPVDKLEKLRNELDSYRSLSAGWDGPESVAPDAAHLDDAANLLQILPAGIPLPRPMLSSNGEVAFYWRLDNLFADIVIEGNGIVSIFIRQTSPTVMESFWDNVQIDESLRQRLLSGFSGRQKGTNARL